MDDVLMGKEALELAIKAEEKGAALYKTLAKNSKNFAARIRYRNVG